MKTVAARLAALAKGLPPDELALLLAVGLVLGTFPVYGCPTLLCAAAAIALRMNAAGLQIVNQISTPLQLALIVPLARAGWRVSISSHAPWLVSAYAVAIQAISGWFMICVPSGVALYLILRFALRRIPCGLWPAKAPTAIP